MKVKRYRIIAFVLTAMMLCLFGGAFGYGAASKVYAADTKQSDSWEDRTGEVTVGDFTECDLIRVDTLDEIVSEESPQPTDDEIQEAMAGAGNGSIVNRDWYSYSSKYFYQTLSSQQKLLYQDMYAYCMYYLVTEDSNNQSPANYKTVGINAGGQIKYESLTRFFKYTDYGLSYYAQADQVFMVFLYENPQFYFLDAQYYRTNDGMYMTFYDRFANSTVRARTTNDIFTKVDSFAAKVAAEKTDYDKVKRAQQLICDNNDYAWSMQIGYTEYYDQSIYSSILMGKTVCAGYSKGTMAVLRKAGTKTITVTSSNHAWNMVKVGANWYNLDTTWDDDTSGKNYPVNYYFLIADANLTYYDSNSESHILNPDWTLLGKPVCLRNYSSDTFTNPAYSTSKTDPDARNEFKKTYIPQVTPEISLSSKTFEYTGGVIRPAISVKAAGTVLNASQYTVAWPDSKDIGKYTVRVTLNSACGYTGTGTAQYVINPKKTSISKIKAGSGSLKIKIKKGGKSTTTGYQIQYSKKKSFGGKKTVTLKSYKKNSKTVKGLKSGKKYYVRVRTYKTVKGKKYYSAWSKVKKVKVK